MLLGRFAFDGLIKRRKLLKLDFENLIYGIQVHYPRGS
jgi:hypothetical protein